MGKYDILEYLLTQYQSQNKAFLSAEKIRKAIRKGNVRKQLRVLFLDGWVQTNSGVNGWRKGYRVHPHRLKRIEEMVKNSAQG